MVLERRRRVATTGGKLKGTPTAKVQQSLGPKQLASKEALRKARRQVVHTLLYRLAYRVPKIADILSELEGHENLELELLHLVLAQEVEGHPTEAKYRYVRSPNAMQHAPQQVIVYMDLLSYLYETLDLSSKGGLRLDELSFPLTGSSHTLAKFFKARVFDAIHVIAKHHGAVLPEKASSKLTSGPSPMKMRIHPSACVSIPSPGKNTHDRSPPHDKKSPSLLSAKKAGRPSLSARRASRQEASPLISIDAQDDDLVVLEESGRRESAVSQKRTSGQNHSLMDLHEHFMVSIQDVVGVCSKGGSMV